METQRTTWFLVLLSYKNTFLLISEADNTVDAAAATGFVEEELRYSEAASGQINRCQRDERP